MVDYAKKTVVELQEILKGRGLPSSGKKADLVARLAEADKAAEENAETTAPPPEATTAPPAQTTKALVEPAQAPAAGAGAATTSQPTAGETAAASPSANTDTALAQSASYALNLPQSDVDAELAKRKARAERFGTGAANGEGTVDKDDEAAKTLERAKRFGTGTTAMGKLDEALPSERERGARKRARDEARAEVSSALEDPALRRGFRGRGGGGGGGRVPRGGRDGERRDSSRRRGERPTGVQKSGAGSAYTSEKDRLAAEARKKRFTTAS